MNTDSFVQLARQYLRAADCLSDDRRALLPTLQLYGQAMELALKAFIAKSGKEPKPVHALRTLLDTAKKHGLVTTDSEEAVITRLHQVFYETDGGFRYATRYPTPVTGFVWSGHARTQMAIESVLSKG